MPIGDRFTMGARLAAMACTRYFDFETVIPCHYGTFPILTGTPKELQEYAPAHISIHALQPGDTMDLAPLQRVLA